MQNCNVEKIKILYKPISISFKEITLLSEEEYIKNRELISLMRGFWWLRSPGYYKFNATYVRSDGILYDFDVNDDRGGVRPALKMQGRHDLIPGDKIRIAEYTFTVLHGDLVLCDTCIGTSMFDYESNNFETSVIRKYLYNWAEENGIVFEKS